MERSKSIASILVGIAALLIIWRVGFYPPVPGSSEVSDQAQTASSTETPASTESRELAASGQPPETSDVNEAGPDDSNDVERLFASVEPNGIEEPNEPLVSLNMNNTDMKLIVQRLTEWTGKTIIPSDESMRQRITIYAPKRIPRSEALSLIYSALRMKGYIARQEEKVMYIEPLSEAKLSEVPIIPSDKPLAMIENKEQIVQKFFSLKNYSPSQMGQILLPLIGEYGYIGADEDTGSLQVIDTVKNLMRISLIIEQFDVVESEATITEIFEIRHSDPTELIEILQTLMGDGGVTDIRTAMRNMRDIRNAANRPGQDNRNQNQDRQGRGNNDNNASTRRAGTRGSGTATSVSVGTTRTRPVLVAVTKLNWIVAKATDDDLELIREWIDKLDKPVQTILVDVPLASIENKNQIVQKFFKLDNYSPSQMAQVISPLLNDSGYVTAEESTRVLYVIDTVENLIRIEGIIKAFDVPEAEQAVQQIFEIQYGDPSEIVQLLKMLLSEDSSTSRSVNTNTSTARGSNRNTRNTRNSRGITNTAFGGSFRAGTSSTVVGDDDVPVILIPEPKRNWIIARGSAEIIKQIDEWIIKLDQKETLGKDYESIPVVYIDVTEVATRINEWLEQMPGTDIRASVLVQPLSQARQVLVYGRADLREMVKKLIQEVDIPTGELVTEHFKLKHADPDEIKEKLDELYSTSGSSNTNRSYYYIYTSASSRTSQSDTVKVISYIQLRQVTVIASPENMEKIRKQIAEWDIPIDAAALKPRIIELNNVDPVQMADLLTTLFSSEGTSSSSSTARTRQMLSSMFGTTTADRQKIIGPLYGQLTFEDVPGTKKIIVISNIAEAYDVVEDLVRELDKEEMAEVPKVVTLKFADPERLSEVLNAMFSEAGASVQIQLSDSGLSAYSMDSTTNTTDSSTTQTQSGYTPYWASSGARNTTDTERPISNVIGRIRFVPDTRTKSILVLSPPEFIPKIEELIAELDTPGKQVMIKAVIVEVDHQDLSSLGVQVATNSGAFGTLDENAITALSALEQLDTHGSTAFNSSTIVTNTLTANVNVLIDFMIKRLDAKILNQQTLWTEDNEEASFFKGQRVAFFTSASTSATAGNVQNFEFQKVGMNLAVRPSITPNNDVDMIVNIIISQLSGEEENGQPVRTEMETKTNMIVGDGQTLMLGGILFQQDMLIHRKLPLLGDIPILGGLFGHKETTASNNEMLVFITPYVIDEPNNTAPETKEEIERSKQKLDEIREDLNVTMGALTK